MKKVFISKNDSVAEVVEKIISEPESEIILVIPRETILSDSLSDFRLIKREADAAGKKIIIESVDEAVLSLAKSSHIDAVHPLFRKKSSSTSDIVLKGSNKSQPKVEEEIEEEVELISESDDEETKENEGVQRPLRNVISPYQISKTTRPPFSFKKIIWIAVPIVIIAGIFIFLNISKKATVAINFKAIPFEYQGNFSANINIKEADISKNLIPAETFTQEKNLTELYPASSRKSVSEKATGKIKIYNTYSSDPQALVATTRFLTADGRIYRLDKNIIVPGAEIKDGQIIAVAIEADVTADKAGVNYNSGPIEHLSIPGFKGSPKYEKFYGSLVKASGGFIGERAFPSDKDIKLAKEKIGEVLKSSFNKDLGSVLPPEFKLLEKSSQVKIVRTSVNTQTDDKGNFSVFGEALFEAVGFRETDLKSVLLELAHKDNPNTIFKNLGLEYKVSTVNFEKGLLNFELNSNGTLTQDFDIEKFKLEIIGHNVDEVNSIIKKLPGLSDAKVSVWPSLFKKLPNSSKRIKIEVN